MAANANIRMPARSILGDFCLIVTITPVITSGSIVPKDITLFTMSVHAGLLSDDT